MAESENKSDGNDQTVYDSLNGIQKSAILMMLLGEEEASEIIKNLGPKNYKPLVLLCIQFKDKAKTL